MILHGYQKASVRFALDHPHCGLFLDMGLGKTLSSIAVMDILKRRGENLKWLVIAPKRIAEQSWPDDLDKWAQYHTLSWRVMPAGPTARADYMAGRLPDVTLMGNSTAVLGWLDDHVTDWPWDGLIIDELSAFRNPNAGRFRILKRRRRGMRRVIGLTGTPVPKSLDNLWAEIYLLDGGKALGSSITKYRLQWFHPGAHDQYVVYEWLPNRGAYDEIMAAIDPFCLTMLAKDKLPDLPQETVVTHHLTMPRATRRAYDQLRRDMVTTIDPHVVTAVNAGVLTAKLSQLASGFLYPDPDDPDGEIIDFDTVKLDALADIVEAAQGDPVLVFHRFKYELARIKKKLGEAVHTIDEKNVIARWNAGDIPVLAVNPASAGHGLNLQYGGHICVWMTAPWDLELWQQANARLHRQGQTRVVQRHMLVEDKTVDGRILDVLERRADLQRSVMRALGE